MRRFWKIPVIVLSFGAALILPSACKAQEVSPDHFTDTGVQDVFPAAPHKVAAPRLKSSLTLQARNHQTNLPAALHASAREQVAAKTDASFAALPSALTIQEKRRTVRPPLNPKKSQ
jgi:hypothetical protein